MKKFKAKKVTLIGVLSFMFLIFSLAFFDINNNIAKAATENVIEEFTGYSSALNETDLYDQTNTYKYNTGSYGDLTIKDYFITNASGKTNERVTTAAPQITVITHGLDGRASHWSNIDGKFAYDSDSIMSRLDRELLKAGRSGANIYLAKMKYNKSFQLFDLKDDENRDGDNYEQNSTTTKITDNSKHIILVFEAHDSSAHNYEVYEDFNYMMSKIVYDVKLLNGGLLPKINLIGHSRGGLTNLQYTLDHPDMVASVFSIGTPYLGSNTAASEFGALVAKNSNGRKDIITSEIYNHFYDRWKNGNYSKIPVYALGSYQTVDYLCELLRDNKELLATYDLSLTDTQINALNTAFKLLNPSFVSWLVGKIMPDYKDAIELFAEDIVKDGWWKAVYKNDVLVNLDSQLGKDKNGKNYGFKKYSKCYESGTGKYAVPSWPEVGHNMEPRDKDFIDYILSNITLGERTEKFMYSETSSNTATITGYSGEDLTGNIVIPSVINGYTITATGYDVFKGKGNGVTSVRIPATIKEIGDYSFANLPNLTSVTLETGSGLERIGFRAFAGSSRLSRFNSTTSSGDLNLKSGVKKVDSYAFYGTNFKKIDIGSAIEDIGLAAFSCNPELKEISVSANANYASYNNVLYETSSFGRILQYPIGSSVQSYVLPQAYEDSIKYVSESAFEGADKLTLVDLKNIHTISRFAFSDCSKLSTVNGAKDVRNIPETAFQGTAVFDNAPFAYVGRVLLKYNGKNFWKLTADRFPSGVEVISPFAFTDDNTLEEIILPTYVSSIEDYAFVGCGKLKSIKILGEKLPQINDSPVSQCNDNLEIAVRRQNIESLTAQSSWQKYKNVLTAAYTDVHFKNIDLHTRFYCGENITIPDCKQTGSIFKGWKPFNTTAGIMYGDYLKQKIWDSPEKEITYKADFQAITQYSLVFHNGDERVGTMNIKVGNSFVFNQKSYKVNGVEYPFSAARIMDNCVYSGHIFPASVNGVQTAVFNGWKINGEFVNSGTWVGKYDQEVLDVYADWTPVEFTATLNDEFYGNSTLKFHYYDEITLPVRSRPGYTMEGWVTASSSVRLRTIEEQAGDVELYAYYNPKTYKLILISKQHIQRTVNYYGEYGEVITLPELTYGEYYYVYQWGRYHVKARYVFGVSHPDTIEETAVALWRGKSYNIHYENIRFQGVKANISLKTGSGSPTKYDYGKGLDLSNVTATWSSGSPDAVNSALILLGWYTDSALSKKITSISTTSTGDITVYARWRYDCKFTLLDEGFTITDAGPFDPSQKYDIMQQRAKTNQLIDYLQEIKITQLVIRFKIRLKEINDGYQHIYFYGGAGSDNKLWETTIEHGPGVVDKNYELYEFKIVIPLEKLRNVAMIYIRYDGSGFWDDDWFTDLRYIKECYTVDEKDADLP